MIKFEKKLVNNKIKRLVYEKLLSLYNNKDWALGIMVSLKSDDDCRSIINDINNGVTDTDELILRALELRGFVRVKDKEFDGNPEDIINLDDE